MGQIKIYGHRKHLELHRRSISDAVHQALVEAFSYPLEKRFQRFLPLDEASFVHPEDRSERYLIIEVLLFSGRSAAAKKSFYQKVLKYLESEAGMSALDVEIVLVESERENWCIRGTPGDELKLNYTVTV